ncbi:MAG TPA: AbrB/MazE/SpoVT family DNA-binding domain-containing protein [Gemmataceae bacterium]|nr:AbrB/MazE/SpoVT family DNA-binding domain-containing protein [Gemmataceae bacterium]
MQAQIGKWGNSLAVRIPSAYAKGLNLAEGTEVDIVVVDGGLLLKRRPAEYSLDELIAGITPENRHDETDWGPPVGDEAW